MTYFFSYYFYIMRVKIRQVAKEMSELFGTLANTTFFANEIVSIVKSRFYNCIQYPPLYINMSQYIRYCLQLSSLTRDERFGLFCQIQNYLTYLTNLKFKVSFVVHFRYAKLFFVFSSKRCQNEINRQIKLHRVVLIFFLQQIHT